MKWAAAIIRSMARLRTFAPAVLIGSWSASALGQAKPPPGSTAPAAAPSTPSSGSEPTRETLAKISARHEELARLLDPKEYGRAFFVGAQAELIGPTEGVSGLLFGYDAVFAQFEGSVGIGVGGDPVNNTSAPSTYAFDVRAALPVHRGVRADFSILAGGGTTLVVPPDGGWYTLTLVLAGGRIRSFLGPNVAVTATVGLAAILRGDHSEVVVGARPLGGASVAYFFR